MSDGIAELARRLIIGHKRDGRSIYDAQAKHELILACREPGASMAKIARECGVNANQLASWVRQYERATAGSASTGGEVVDASTPTFVPVHIEPPHLRAPSQHSICRRGCPTASCWTCGAAT